MSHRPAPTVLLLAVALLVPAPHRTLAAAPSAAASAAAAAPAKSAPAPGVLPAAATAAASLISQARLLGDISMLADDALEGRGTATRGYDVAAAYVASRFVSIGLEPGGEDGFLQHIPFRRSVLVEAASKLATTRSGNTRTLALGVDAVLAPDLLKPDHAVEAPLAFVGYGVDAPDQKYSDFAGLDVKGKVVIEFRGAPPNFPPDERAFYSNSLNKEKAAADHGAVGILYVLKPSDESRQPWSRMVRQSRLPALRWIEETGALANTETRIELSGSLSRVGAEALFEGAPRSFSQCAAAAESSVTRSFAMARTIKARRISKLSLVGSTNVVGVLRGSDSTYAQEAIVVSAHLDHLGISEAVRGDSINNGAYDNASGVAAMLETSRAFTSSHGRPRRSIIFLAVTGEEKGLQGSDYFARHSAPFGMHVVGDINLDEVLLLRPVSKVIAFGGEHTTLGPMLAHAASITGFEVIPDPMPEEVVFVRSDQFSFIRQGVPAIFPVAAGDGTPEGNAEIQRWIADRYHSPSDDMTQHFEFESGVRFAKLAFYTIWLAADAAAPPRWNSGDFFGIRFGGGR